MATLDDNALAQPASTRRTARSVGLRIAALAGVVISAGAIATGTTSGDADRQTDLRIDTVVAGGTWPEGSTCCDPQ
jgi:hypothetical protein